MGSSVGQYLSSQSSPRTSPGQTSKMLEHGARLPHVSPQLGDCGPLSREVIQPLVIRFRDGRGPTSAGFGCASTPVSQDPAWLRQFILASLRRKAFRVPQRLAGIKSGPFNRMRCIVEVFDFTRQDHHDERIALQSLHAMPCGCPASMIQLASRRAEAAGWASPVEAIPPSGSATW